MLSSLHQPSRAHERNNDNNTKDHGEKLSLQKGKSETFDDDVVESTETRCGKRGEELNTHVAVNLGVEESLLDLVGTELLVLKTSLVGADTLNHELLVLLGPALGAHGAIGKSENNIYTPDEGDDAVSDEDSLPRSDWCISGVRLEARVSNVGEGVGQKTANNLLHTI